MAKSRRSGCERLRPAAFAALLVVSGCARIDPEQARICRIALPAIEPPGSRISLRDTRAIENGVRIDYASGPAGGEARPHFAACRFALGRQAVLEAITTDRGDIPGATVYLLRRYYIETRDGAAGDPGPEP